MKHWNCRWGSRWIESLLKLCYIESFHFGSSSCTKQAVSVCSALGSPVGSLQPGKHTSLVGICCFCHSEGCQSAFQFQQSIATRERTVEHRKTNRGLACLIDSRWKKTAQSVHVAFVSLTSEKKVVKKLFHMDPGIVCMDCALALDVWQGLRQYFTILRRNCGADCEQYS